MLFRNLDFLIRGHAARPGVRAGAHPLRAGVGNPLKPPGLAQVAQGLGDGQGVGKGVVFLGLAGQPQQGRELRADHLGRREPEEAGEAGPDVDESVPIDGAGDAVENAVLVEGIWQLEIHRK